MREILLPCPFGCANHSLFTEKDEPKFDISQISNSFKIKCPYCETETTWFPTRQDAVKHWNTRAKLPDEEKKLQQGYNKAVLEFKKFFDAEFTKCFGDHTV